MNAILKEEINLKLTGENISLETIDALEIAKFIISFIETLKPLVGKEEDIPCLMLQEIKQGSIDFIFATQHPKTKWAYSQVTHSLSTNNYHDLPAQSIQHLRNLSNQIKKLNCSVIFYDTHHKCTAEITPSINIKIPEIVYIEGETTLYGYIENVGGKKPQVRITLTNGKKLICKINDKEKIRKLGALIYTEVGLVGIAKWQMPEMEIIDFEIQEILEYRESSIFETMNTLSKIAGDSFDSLDVNSWIAEIRGHDA